MLPVLPVPHGPTSILPAKGSLRRTGVRVEKTLKLGQFLHRPLGQPGRAIGNRPHRLAFCDGLRDPVRVQITPAKARVRVSQGRRKPGRRNGIAEERNGLRVVVVPLIPIGKRAERARQCLVRLARGAARQACEEPAQGQRRQPPQERPMPRTAGPRSAPRRPRLPRRRAGQPPASALGTGRRSHRGPPSRARARRPGG